MARREFRFPPVQLPEAAERLRSEVRAFIAEELASGSFTPECDSWLSGFSPEFSRKLGQRGWIGMTWPKTYGGHERTALERFVVTEELLAVGAPVAAHWIGDRQSGPLLLRFGTEEQRQRFLPQIVKGECYFGIGMSEPDSGSDLASIRTSARREGDVWLLTGRKVWTSHAHRANFLIVLARTAPATEERHAGMSQFLVPLDAPGVTVRG
ncbi:MAG: acyl-CoA dehydrogenase family protein, partial [Chloroflexi bacterium]|nr:acyl-CoA dehydrogenase family protein [Chloroflexota bacterium]